MDRTAQALELVAPHCDLEDRLRHVPPAAAIRGVFFNNVERYLQKTGKFAAYRRFFPDDHFASFTYYPLSDYLIRFALAGAMVRSAPDVHQGMREIGRSHATGFVQSLLGRTLVRLLSRDPLRLTEQGVAARRQTHRYGRWTIVYHGPRKVEVVYEDEYLWIESAIAGAAEGTYVECDAEVSHETTLRSRFQGSTIHSW